MSVPRATMGPDAELLVPLSDPIDLIRTLAPIAHGSGDPTIRFESDGIWRATRTAGGPATLRLAEADGPGADIVRPEGHEGRDENAALAGGHLALEAGL